jgi:hypothetical protein
MEAPCEDYNELTGNKRKGIVKIPDMIQEETVEERNAKPTELENENEIREKDSNEIKELNANDTEGHSEEYWKQLKEIKERLPTEIKDFADVFCSED